MSTLTTTPAGQLDAAAKPQAEHATPVAQAWRLLKPDLNDIGMVVLFALVVGLLAMATPLAVEALVNTVAFGRVLQPVVVLSGFLDRKSVV